MTHFPSYASLSTILDVAATNIGKRTLPSHVSTDSRRLPEGALFVALEGERFDGHAFLQSALESGASGVIVHKGRTTQAILEQELWVFEVEDTLVALGAVARAVREAWGGPAVGITGSAGKTTSKALLRAVLEPSRKLHVTPGNWNNRIGLPLTLFQLNDPEISILELGTSEPGEIQALADIALPNVSWITNVGEAHLEGLGSLEGVAIEKTALFRGTQPGGTLVVNLDDPRIVAHLPQEGWKHITYGSHESADIQIQEVDCSSPGEVQVRLRIDGASYSATLPGLGVHMGHNVAGAVASAIALGITPAEAMENLKTYEGPKQRMNIRDVNGIHVIDDCYNANPTSTEAAVVALGQLSTNGRKFAVLGDMLELGNDSASLHRRVGAIAHSVGLDGLITVGREAREIAVGLRDAEGQSWVQEVEQAEEVWEILAPAVQPGDWVLVKGSRGVQLERVVTQMEGGKK